MSANSSSNRSSHPLKFPTNDGHLTVECLQFYSACTLGSVSALSVDIQVAGHSKVNKRCGFLFAADLNISKDGKYNFLFLSYTHKLHILRSENTAGA